MARYGQEPDEKPVRRTGDVSVLADYVTHTELAAQLGITERTLRQWRARGDAPPITRLGLRILFHRDDVKDWLLSRRMRAA
jgi:excisionase family DNA binding protein